MQDYGSQLDNLIRFAASYKLQKDQEERQIQNDLYRKDINAVQSFLTGITDSTEPELINKRIEQLDAFDVNSEYAEMTKGVTKDALVNVRDMLSLKDNMLEGVINIDEKIRKLPKEYTSGNAEGLLDEITRVKGEAIKEGLSKIAEHFSLKQKEVEDYKMLSEYLDVYDANKETPGIQFETNEDAMNFINDYGKPNIIAAFQNFKRGDYEMGLKNIQKAVDMASTGKTQQRIEEARIEKTIEAQEKETEKATASAIELSIQEIKDNANASLKSIRKYFPDLPLATPTEGQSAIRATKRDMASAIYSIFDKGKDDDIPEKIRNLMQDVKNGEITEDDFADKVIEFKQTDWTNQSWLDFANTIDYKKGVGFKYIGKKDVTASNRVAALLEAYEQVDLAQRNYGDSFDASGESIAKAKDKQRELIDKINNTSLSVPGVAGVSIVERLARQISE